MLPLGSFPLMPSQLSYLITQSYFLTYFHGGHRNFNSQGRNSAYTILESWKSSPLADSGCNSALFCSFGFGVSFPHIVLQHKQRLDPTAANRNGATTTIRHLCRDLTWHPHTSNYVPLNMPSSEDQTAQQWAFSPSFFTVAEHFPVHSQGTPYSRKHSTRSCRCERVGICWWSKQSF